MRDGATIARPPDGNETRIVKFEGRGGARRRNGSQARANLGRLRHERQNELGPLAPMRVAQHFFGEIGAAAALARATGQARQLAQAAHALGGGLADHFVGDGVADTDVHGCKGGDGSATFNCK